MKKTVDYDRQMFADIMTDPLDYLQTGETVCGAEDPAVIELSDTFKARYPKYAGYTVVRVIDRFVNANQSDTLFEFSNDPVSDADRAAYEDLLES